MTEQAVVEKVVDPFDSGFAGGEVLVDPSRLTDLSETPPNGGGQALVDTEEGGEQPSADGGEPNGGVPSEPAAAAEAATTPATPIDSEAYAALMKRVEELDATSAKDREKIDQVFGRLGGTERFIKELQAQTPVGESINVTPEDLKELGDEMQLPQVADAVAKGLNRVLGKLKGTGAKVASPDPAEIERQVADRVEAAKLKIKQELQVDRVNEVHPDWVTLKDTPEFKEYLGTLDDKTKATLSETWEPSFLIPFWTNFKKFRSEKQAPAPAAKPTQRQAVMAAAVQPKGTTAPPPKGEQTADEAFDAGFKS